MCLKVVDTRRDRLMAYRACEFVLRKPFHKKLVLRLPENNKITGKWGGQNRRYTSVSSKMCLYGSALTYIISCIASPQGSV
jgi:hypothetical protein